MKFKMLSMLLIACTMLAPKLSLSQFVTRMPKDSLVDAATKTLTWTSTPANVVSFQITFVKSTGTAAATVQLQTRCDTISTTDWTRVFDSTYTVTNVAAQSYLIPVVPAYGNGYRFVITGSGTQKTYIYASYLRR